MKTRILFTALAILFASSFASAGFFKDLFNAGKAIANEYKRAVDSGKCDEILTPSQRAKFDAITSSGVGGKILTGASAVVDIYSQISGNDCTKAKDVFNGAISNYNTNNQIIEDHNWTNNNNSSVINSVYSLGVAAESMYNQTKVAENNEAFLNLHKIYTDPESSAYDPYFFETLKYDNSGRIIGRMDSYERINTIKEINQRNSNENWDNTFNSVVDRNIPDNYDRNTYIEENHDKIRDETLREIAHTRKENMQNYIDGKYNEIPQMPHESDTILDVTPSTPTSVTIGGFELNATAIDDQMSRQLDEAYQIILKYPYNNILIIGNTCDLGSDKVNYKKGLQRAENAKAYLIEKGIADDRINTQSDGASNPIAENSSEENRKLNRRIEILLAK